MLNPEINDFLAVWNQKWSSLKKGATPRERDLHFEKIALEMRLPTPADVNCEEVRSIASPAGAVRVRFFRHTSQAVQPCLIYMHGGAWMQGSPETHWDITARLASFAQMTVISVDYAKAPEHPFPAAVLNCAAVVEWAFDNAESLGIDAARISIGGDSAGANLAAAMALKFRGSEYRLRSQLLIYPAVAFEQSRPSYAENADGPLLTTASMPAVNDMYVPNVEDREDPLAAPIKARDHSRLPPAFIAVAEHDPLRDDGVDYADVLRQAGTPVVLDFAEGLIHGYLRAHEFCAASRIKLETMGRWIAEQNHRG